MPENHPLENYRKSHNPPKTRADLARDLAVSKTTIARWEKGIRKIDEDLLAHVSKKTGIPAKDLRPDVVERHRELFGEGV